MNQFLKLKILFFCSFFLSGFLAWGNAQAADHYVRADATGNNDGSDWTNAYTDLPASLTRGDTYYIADGTYGSYVFDDPLDGEKIITIKKSTVADHGTDTGYSEADHNGQSVFEPADSMPSGALFFYTLRFDTSYYTLDGVTDGLGNQDNYGFKVNIHPSYGSEEGIYAGFTWSLFVAIGSGSTTASNIITDIKILNVAMPGKGQLACVEYAVPCKSNGVMFYYIRSRGGSFRRVEVANCYSSGHKENYNFQGGYDSSLHHSYAHYNTNSGVIPGSPNQAHGQQINLDTVDKMDIYNNIITDSQDFLIAMHQQFGDKVRNVRVYNNIFSGIADIAAALSGGISAMKNDSDTVKGMQVHHNTFVDIPSLGKGAFFISKSTNTETDLAYAYNNLFYNCVGATVDNSTATASPPTTYVGLITNDNNAYMASTGYSASAGNQIDAAAPSTIFTNYYGNVFTINAASQTTIDHIIGRGKTDLGSPYNVDMADNSRDASPDIGAYEYVGAADTVAPASPTGLAVI